MRGRRQHTPPMLLRQHEHHFLSNVVPVRSFGANGLGAGRCCDGHLIEV